MFFFSQGDICEPDFMRYIFQEEKFDSVLHYAAQSHVGKCGRNPSRQIPMYKTPHSVY